MSPDPGRLIDRLKHRFFSKHVSRNKSTTTDELPEDTVAHSDAEADTSGATWNTWKLEIEADLNKLEDWNRNHPEDSKLEVFLTKVSKAFRSPLCQITLDFIPDDPFPAGTLVKAVISLVSIVTEMPEIKREVYQFAMRVVDDMNCAATAIDESNDQVDPKLLIAIWNDLLKWRDIVSEICRWASRTLVQTVVHSTSTQKEIREFKEKLAHADSMFVQRSMIKILYGLRRNGGKLEELLDFNQVSERLAFIKRAVGNRLVEKAKYEEQTKDACHEDTREDVLAQINEWVRISSPERCWWITGRAAIGKSAIGITTAACLKDKRPITPKPAQLSQSGVDEIALVAQFFVNYLIPDTTKPDSVFLTMAWQLANGFPIAAAIIHDAVYHMPSITDRLSIEQARTIFVQPLCVVAQNEPGTFIVVIDGVDELACTDADVLAEFTSIISIIASEVSDNVKILVFSRPEQAILDNIGPHIRRIKLETERSKLDVERFLRSELTKFASLRRWEDWPTWQQIDILCQVADGHLGTAKFAFQWIARLLKEEGELFRNTVFHDIENAELTGVNNLYAFVLDRVIPETAPRRRIEGTKAVIGCLTVLPRPQRVDTISALLSLNDFDVLHFIRQISSIVVDGTDPVGKDTIPRPHKSFIDYIISGYPQPRFRITPAEHNLRLFRTVLDPQRVHFNIAGILTSYEGNSKTVQCPIPTATVYACVSAEYHLDQSGEIDALDIERFMYDQFLFWFEAMCLEKNSFILNTLLIERLMNKCEDNELIQFMADAKTFIRQFEDLVSDYVPHLYISALPFAPSSPFSDHYRRRYPHTLSVKRHLTRDKMYKAKSAAICGDRILVQTGCDTVDVFDAAVGTTLFSVTTALDCEIPEHSSVYSAFSPDGQFIALGVRICRVWIVGTGEEAMNLTPPPGNPHITCITFSVDSTYIVVGYWTGNIYMWDCTSGGNDRTTRLEGHTGRVSGLACSPDGTRLASGSDDRTVRVWNMLDGSCLSRLAAHIESITSITFCPTQSQVAFQDASGDLLFWDTATQDCWRNEFTASVLSFAFSPDGRFLALGMAECIQIVEISTGCVLPTLLASSVQSIVFFPDGKRIMSTERYAVDTIVRVWDIESLLNGNMTDMDGWQRGSEKKRNGGYRWWIMNMEGQLLFPEPERPFRHLRNTLMIGSDYIDLDITHYVHGDQWHRCREPLTD